jgi:hypothetical protein
MSNPDDKKKVKITGAPQLSDMILGSLKPRVGKETTKWVAGLTEDALEAAEQAARMQGVEMLTSSDQVPHKPPHVAITHFMDYLFDCFQQYEFEYNRSAPAPEMLISVDRPTTVVETLHHSLRATETRQVFRGRISTRQWTLLLRGHDNEMEGFLLPIDQLISFASEPTHYTQFLRMTGEPDGDDMLWSVEGVEVSWDKIRSFGKQLFAALLHVAKTGMSEGLVFSFGNKETPKSSATASGASKAAPAEPTYSFDDHNPAFDEMGYSVPGSTPSKPKPAAPTEENLAATQPRLTKSAVSKAASGQIEAALDQLQKAFGDELETLAASGQAAFAKQDMATVEKIFQRTNKIKQLRDQANSQIASWKAALKSD